MISPVSAAKMIASAMASHRLTGASTTALPEAVSRAVV